MILANYLTELYPEAAFYLFPMRFWELALGGIAAILYLKDQKPQSVSLPTFIFQSVSLLGLSLVIASVIYFSSISPHPGLITLVPTLGTTLIIWGSRSGTLVARLLPAKPFV